MGDNFSLHVANGLLGLFGTVTGTLGSFKRANPSNIKLGQQFLKEDKSDFNDIWWKVVDIVKPILDLVEKLEFDPPLLETKLKAKKKNELAALRCDLGEFRLIVAIKLCLMSGVIAAHEEKRTQIRNIQYSIKGRRVEK